MTAAFIMTKPLEMVQDGKKQCTQSLEFKVKIPIVFNSLSDLGQVTPGFGLNFLICRVPPIYTLACRKGPLHMGEGVRERWLPQSRLSMQSLSWPGGSPLVPYLWSLLLPPPPSAPLQHVALCSTTKLDAPSRHCVLTSPLTPHTHED